MRSAVAKSLLSTALALVVFNGGWLLIGCVAAIGSSDLDLDGSLAYMASFNLKLVIPLTPLVFAVFFIIYLVNGRLATGTPPARSATSKPDRSPPG